MNFFAKNNHCSIYMHKLILKIKAVFLEAFWAIYAGVQIIYIVDSFAHI